MGFDGHLAVERVDELAGALDFRTAHVGLGVDDLPLEVRGLDHVRVDQVEGPDARGRQVGDHRRSQSAGAHDQDLGVLDPLLAGPADHVDRKVPGVAVLAARVAVAHRAGLGVGPQNRVGASRRLRVRMPERIG